MARRRHHAVPRREEHELGRRLPRAGHDALAGRHQAGHRDQRHHVARGLGADAGRGGRRAERQGEAADRLRGGGQDLQGPSRRLRPARLAGRHRPEQAQGVSSTGPTTAISPPCATTAGSSSSWSSGPRASTCGRTRWCRCAFRSSSTCAPTPSRSPTAYSGDYDNWRVEHAFAARARRRRFVAQHLQTYVEFPPRQKPGSFSLDQVLAKLQEAGG